MAAPARGPGVRQAGAMGWRCWHLAGPQAKLWLLGLPPCASSVPSSHTCHACSFQSSTLDSVGCDCQPPRDTRSAHVPEVARDQGTQALEVVPRPSCPRGAERAAQQALTTTRATTLVTSGDEAVPVARVPRGTGRLHASLAKPQGCGNSSAARASEATTDGSQTPRRGAGLPGSGHSRSPSPHARGHVLPDTMGMALSPCHCLPVPSPHHLPC